MPKALVNWDTADSGRPAPILMNQYIILSTSHKRSLHDPFRHKFYLTKKKETSQTYVMVWKTTKASKKLTVVQKQP